MVVAKNLNLHDGYIKEGAIVIDVGTTRVMKLTDVAFDKAVQGRMDYPVPGGGPYDYHHAA